jgi:hypothetical protein
MPASRAGRRLAREGIFASFVAGQKKKKNPRKRIITTNPIPTNQSGRVKYLNGQFLSDEAQINHRVSQSVAQSFTEVVRQAYFLYVCSA